MDANARKTVKDAPTLLGAISSARETHVWRLSGGVDRHLRTTAERHVFPLFGLFAALTVSRAMHCTCSV